MPEDCAGSLSPLDKWAGCAVRASHLTGHDRRAVGTEVNDGDAKVDKGLLP